MEKENLMISTYAFSYVPLSGYFMRKMTTIAAGAPPKKPRSVIASNATGLYQLIPDEIAAMKRMLTCALTKVS